MNLSLDEISKAVEGALEGSGTVNVGGYSIDSRTIKPGELFFAIKGPRFDGHAFVAQVFQKGAAAAVVEQGGREARACQGEASSNAEGPMIRVASTLAALQQLARDLRRR